MSKVLHIVESLATGVLRYLLDLSKKQVDLHEVYIIYGIRPLTPFDVEDMFDKRVRLIQFKDFKGISSLFNIYSYINIKKIYKEIDPDIVHLHSSVAGFIGRWSLPVSTVKTFYTPHGFSFLQDDKSKMIKSFFWFLEYISAQRTSKIIACSYGEYLEAKKISTKSTYVNNGIDTELLDFNQKSLFEKNKIIVCTSGRIIDQKNPKLLNQVAELLPDVSFIWIGDGYLKTELSAPNIIVTGWLPRNEALTILSNSQFFILTSLWEGLSYALLEAMYLRRVCLVSDVIGNRDVIRNNENGFVCKSAGEYAACIKNGINGIVDYELMGKNCQDDITSDYNINLMAKKYDLLYFG